MSETPARPPGTIAWADLTVPNAEAVRDFYARVTGWTPQPLSMQGGYDDYVMNAPGTAQAVAGICHARGPNADLPAQWILYIIVADLDASLQACQAAGGELVAGPRAAGGTSRFAVIRDPAGAVAALFQNA